MFVNYLTLLLINLVAGLVILAYFAYVGGTDAGKRAVPGLLVTGFVATVFSTHMILTWPLPGSFNIAYGEMSLLFGVLLLCTGIATAAGWDLLTVTVYGFFAGLAAVVVGIRFVSLGLSQEPAVAATGFILTGAGAILTFPLYFARKSKLFRLAVGAVFLAAAAVWAITGYGAYWTHLETFAG